MGTTSVANTSAGLSGQTLLITATSQTVTGLKTFDRGINSPFACVSGAAKVDNLDADKLDGREGSYFIPATKVTTELELTTQLAAWGSGTIGTILFDSIVVIAASLSVPANVTLWFLPPGAMSMASGQTATISGAILAPRSYIFQGDGAYNVTDAKIDHVYPEWYGAVALKAASGTPSDSTTALQAAAASKRNVFFDQGIYGTTNVMEFAADGQKFIGQGINIIPTDGQGGTTILRLSGTNRIIKGTSYYGTELKDLSLDGNSLGGELCRWQSIHSGIVNVEFKGQGGTDYALYLISTNLSRFQDLYFRDGNYGHIKTDGTDAALYPRFYHVSMGTVNGGKGLLLQNSVGGKVYGMYCDAEIQITGTVEDWLFDGLDMETAGITAVPVVTIDSANCGDIAFRSVRLFRASVATTLADFALTSCSNITIDGLYSRDSASAAGRPVILLNGALSCTFRDLSAYHGNTFDLIECTGTRSDRITVENATYKNGSVGSLVWKSAFLNVSHTNCPQSFLASSEEINLRNCAGTVTRTNTSKIHLDPTCTNYGDVIAFADTDATPSVATGMVGAAFSAENTIATVITNFDDGFDGQEILVRFTNGNTTIDFSANANLKGNAGVDFVGAAGASLWARRAASVWRCLVSAP